MAHIPSTTSKQVTMWDHLCWKKRSLQRRQQRQQLHLNTLLKFCPCVYIQTDICTESTLRIVLQSEVTLIKNRMHVTVSDALIGKHYLSVWCSHLAYKWDSVVVADCNKESNYFLQSKSCEWVCRSYFQPLFCDVKIVRPVRGQKIN